VNNTEYMKKKWYRHYPLVTKVESKEELKENVLMWLNKNEIGAKLNIIINGKIKVYQKIDKLKIIEIGE